MIVQIPEGGHGFSLLVADAQAVIDNAVVDDLEFMAKERGPFELAQQGLGELFKGVREDDDLRQRPKTAEEFERALERTQGSDDALDVREFQSVPVQEIKSKFHELIVVGLIACGASQLGDTGFL